MKNMTEFLRGKYFTLSALMLAVCLLAAAPLWVQASPIGSQTGDESVWADKMHYAVGETVLIRGNGFEPVCQVSVQVVRPDRSVESSTLTTDAGGTLAFDYVLADLKGQYEVNLLGSDGGQLTGTAFTNGPFVMLDKGDYRPNEIVHVKGTAFSPGSFVIVRVVRPDGSVVKSDGSLGSDMVFVDAESNFAYDYVIREGVVDVYQVSVLDQSGRALAGTTFTDSDAFVKNIGFTSLGGAVSSLTITVPAGGVAAGNSIIIGGSGSTTGGLTGCTDSKGNTYTVDISQLGNGGSVSIASAHNVKALAAGDTITAYWPGGGSGRAMSANEFSGLAPTSTLDQVKGAAGGNSTPTSGMTALTSQADEVLFGAIWYNGTNNGTFVAPGTGASTGVPPGTYTLTNPAIETGRKLATEYRVATSKGTYAASGTLSTGNFTASVIATYKFVPCNAPEADAGPDQSVCDATTATLAGNDPLSGTGAWTTIAGDGVVTTPSSPTSGVTGLSIGDNEFKWTITQGTCPSTSDTVVIRRYGTPTAADAGPDQTLCAATATLAGNEPTVGTGKWTRIAGSGAVTTPSSPTSGVTGLGVGVNTFSWTISNGACADSTDDVTITYNEPPTTAAAGPDQQVCDTTATLAGNTPQVGTGLWTRIAGSGAVTTPGSPTSGVTGLGVGVNTFSWTISNGTCPDSTDDITITRYEPPTAADAGPDQKVCATTATLAGNAPTVGTGEWTRIAGSAVVTTPSLRTSGVTGLGVGDNTFRWTISNGACADSTDDVTITYNEPPTPAAAGPDQKVCAETATLAGNAPTAGTGAWTTIAGSGLVTTPSSPTSGVTGLGVGVNTFRWTTSNGTCTDSTDDITITRYEPPTPAAAGPDQTVCTATATLAGNTPQVGTGAWTKIAGSGAVTTPSSPTSGVTGLGVGVNTFSWTISNGACADSTDDVTIAYNEPPTTAAAGPDQQVCDTTATLAGNTPQVGTGVWSLFSGAGTVTTPGSPTSGVTALGPGANTFRWTISNGTCPDSFDDITITRDEPPTTAAAGPDQTVCTATATLAGNTPQVGTGLWTRIAGSGAVTTPISPTSGVTGLSVGVNTFRWTISNGTCAASTDDVTITYNEPPTTAAAGPDQQVCDTTATLAGNTPQVGTGVWSLFSGAGTVTTPGSPTSGVTALGPGANTFRWTISNGTCPDSTDDITITRYEPPTPAAAGPDQQVCAATATLAGNTPTAGTGAWTTIAGSGTVTTPSSPTSGVTGLSVGVNTFRWTISNGTCPVSTDDVTITYNEPPTTAAAGPDQEVSGTTATLAGNAPTAGTGVWSTIAGSGAVTTPISPTSGVTGLSVGINTFRWTISNGTCPASTDDITVKLTVKRVFAFTGFDSPIDNQPVVNSAKAGSTVPVKWRITDLDGTPIADPASFISLTSYSVGCGLLTGSPVDELETYAGASGLQYFGDGYWQFNWKTAKGYVGQCRVMILTLADGSTHAAYFKFK